MDQELELVRIALKGRHPDGMDRATRLQGKIIRELAKVVSLERRSKKEKKQERPALINGRIPTEREELNFKQLAARDAATKLIGKLQMVDALIKKYGNRGGERHGTLPAEQLLKIALGQKRYRDPVLSLMMLGHLDPEEVMLAREIASILYSITRRSNAKTSYFPVASEPNPDDDRSRQEKAADALDYAEWMALLHAKVYLPWSDKNKDDFPLVFGLCVEGRAIEELRRTLHIDWNTALNRIKAALKSFAEFRDGYLRYGREEKRAGIEGATLPLPRRAAATA